jgi:serpin B
VKRLHRLSTVSVLLVVACAGTSSGNPAESKPMGAELVRSAMPRDTHPTVSDSDASWFAADNRKFAFDLYSQLKRDDTNLFFSPFSISISLAMTYAGAKADTASEMMSALHFTLPQPQLHAAFNALDRALHDREGHGLRLDVLDQTWAARGKVFLDDYLDVLATNYGAGVFLVDFTQPEATRQAINGWVAQQTEERIAELLPKEALSENTQLVLSNTIFFKASWATAFEPNRTDTAMFHAATAERSVRMMHGTPEAGYTNETYYQAVDLPYVSSDVRMLIVLPDEGEFDTVAKDLESVFDASTATHGSAVALGLPRFRFESANDLKAPLQGLGMQAAFAPDAADFSGMDGTHELYVDGIYHDAFIAVDEQGAEAAAATAVVGDGRVDTSLDAVEVTVDRPFIFMVYDRPTGQILFLGQLADPG